jgi:hypothetical protein
LQARDAELVIPANEIYVCEKPWMLRIYMRALRCGQSDSSPHQILQALEAAAGGTWRAVFCSNQESANLRLPY